MSTQAGVKELYLVQSASSNFVVIKEVAKTQPSVTAGHLNQHRCLLIAHFFVVAIARSSINDFSALHTKLLQTVYALRVPSNIKVLLVVCNFLSDRLVLNLP